MKTYKAAGLIFALLTFFYINTPLLASSVEENSKVINIQTLHFSDSALEAEYKLKTADAIKEIKKLSEDYIKYLVIITGDTTCGEDFEVYASHVEDALFDEKIKPKNVLVKYHKSKNISFNCAEGRRVNLGLALIEKRHEYKTSAVLLNGDKAKSSIIVNTKTAALELNKPLEIVEIGETSEISKPKKISLTELRALTGKILDTANTKKYHFTFYFTSKGAELTDESKESLTSLLELLEGMSKPYVHIGGYADTLGSFEDNHILALKRANAIFELITASKKEYLKIDIQSYSELNLAVPTLDEVSEPLNRRVELSVQ